MKNNMGIQLTNCWDKNVVSAEESSQRGLLIDISSASEKRNERRPVNLSLVIDRSGSMGGAKIAAAKTAAKGVVERLGEEDVLSVVDFDDEVSTLLRGVRLNARGKREAIRVIEQLNTGGMTNLAGGWLEGATCAAHAMDTMDFESGHVVLLSDGHANVGMTDPITLQAHADEMASRGVTTSTVGVGNGYNPLQLEALSEGGLGRLHDAANPEEIIETILGELGEIQSVIATDVTLLVRWPAELRGELLANFKVTQNGNAMTVSLGQLLAGSSRTVPVMIDVPALPEGKVLNLDVVLTGKDPQTGRRIAELSTTTELTVVPPVEAHAAQRDSRVAERFARLWESTIGLDAMRLNERGDYAAARLLVQDASESLVTYSMGTDAESGIRQNLRDMEHRVKERWVGRSKREAMVAAKKYSKGERDYRSSPRGDWSDHLK